MKNKYIGLITFSVLMISLTVRGQESQENKEKNKGLEISGYVQAQYQHFFIADSLGGAPDDFAKFSGGNMPNIYTSDRFQLRRGRLKFEHTSDLTDASLSFDVSSKGISVKDMFVRAYDPWINAFSLTGGIFNRPFGHEIDYSSKYRESPERSRIIQTLFPHEREVGFRLGFQLPEETGLDFFNIEAAIVNGNGSAIETNNHKDFIGHIHFETPKKEEQDFYAGLGFSYYKGKVEHVYNPTDSAKFRYYYIYNFSDAVQDTAENMEYIGFERDYEASRAAGNMETGVDRIYYGIDGQLEVKLPFGKAEIKGEYMWGTQPGIINTNKLDKMATIYHSITTSSPDGPDMGVSWPIYDSPQPYDGELIGYEYKPHSTMIRQFSGGYLSFVQHIFETGHQLIVKYDWYDPNTEVSGKDIKLNYIEDDETTFTYLSPADIKYSTVGIGWAWEINEHYKITLYYENVKNEITSLKAFTENLIDMGQWPAPSYERDLMDDAFTFRVQYKF
jgi:hypothetical protein